MRCFSYQSSSSIICELGASSRLGTICADLGISKPMIVTDQGIVNSGLLGPIEAALADQYAEICLFCEVIADPPQAIIERAVQLAKAQGVDGVIGFGGGSSLDTAKLVALLANSEQTLDDIYGVDQAQGQRLPLILAPTTAGTGSEVTSVAIVTTGETTKMGVVAPQLYADVALLDARLTIGLPAAITAMTGIDAMVHAVEAYTSIPRKNPYSDMLARQALRTMSANIETATHQGDSIEARQAMLLGACLAGQAFANAPVAAVHALAYPLGGHYHLPHGLSNSLVLPAVLRFNARAAVREYAELAETVIPAEQLQSSEQARCNQFIDYFTQLIKRLSLPLTLAEVDIPEQDLAMLAADAMLQQRLLVNNPRAVTEQDALDIYRQAWGCQDTACNH